MLDLESNNKQYLFTICHFRAKSVVVNQGRTVKKVNTIKGEHYLTLLFSGRQLCSRRGPAGKWNASEGNPPWGQESRTNHVEAGLWRNKQLVPKVPERREPITARNGGPITTFQREQGTGTRREGTRAKLGRATLCFEDIGISPILHFKCKYIRFSTISCFQNEIWLN